MNRQPAGSRQRFWLSPWAPQQPRGFTAERVNRGDEVRGFHVGGSPYSVSLEASGVEGKSWRWSIYDGDGRCVLQQDGFGESIKANGRRRAERAARAFAAGSGGMKEADKQAGVVAKRLVEEAERTESAARKAAEEAAIKHKKARSVLLSVRRQAGLLPREGRGTACAQCMPSWMRSAIAEFRSKYPGFETPEGAQGRSREASEMFANFVFSRYARSMKNTVFQVGTDESPRFVIVVDGWMIDWTARQFDESAPWPRVVGPKDAEAMHVSPDGFFDLCDRHWLMTSWLAGYSNEELRLIAETSGDHGEREAAAEALSARETK